MTSKLNQSEQGERREWGESTRAVHGGAPSVEPGRSITAPIVHASTYPFEDTAELKAYMRGELERPHEYGRYGNPTVERAAAKLAALEGAQACVLMSSGMAAITTTLLTLLRGGQHAVFTADVYRKTRLFAQSVLTRLGVEVSVVAPEIDQIEAALRPNTKLIFTEAPTNPYLRMVDVAALTQLAKSRRIKTIIDSTFATPINFRPLESGIDLVIHSVTKYLGGHNDLLGGAVLGGQGLVSAVAEQVGTFGAVLDANSAFLLIRGLKTLALRMERHNQSALTIATALERHPAVAEVWYPMLESHRDHGLARRYLRGGGGVISFELRGGLEAGTRVCDAVTIPKIAPSLGGVESLIEQPALMSFFDLEPEQRAAIGIREGLVRMSVGIEDCADLLADLMQALDAA